MQYCDILQDLCNRSPRIPEQIMFSSSTTFGLKGSGEKCIYWSKDNRHCKTEGHTRHHQKINV